MTIPGSSPGRRRPEQVPAPEKRERSLERPPAYVLSVAANQAVECALRCSAACAAASRAIGMRNGEHDT